MGARRDPREEQSVPPNEQRVEMLGALPKLGRPPQDIVDAAAAPAPAPEESAPKSGRVVTSDDPRIEAVESALATGDWRKIATDLGALDQAGALPPTLGIVCAVAHRELAGEEAAQAANDLAIRSAAAIFGVSPDSKLAVVLAKRLMRKNPVAWQKRPAPRASTSVLIVLATLVIGGGLGWLFSSGLVRLNVHF